MKELNTYLVVEGGGFKTGFVSGILDAFLINNYNDFDGYIGVSGGSVAISYFLSHQYRQCLGAILRLAQEEDFTNYRRTFGEQGYMNIDFLAEVAQYEVKFDIQKAIAKSKGAVVEFVATHRNTGNPSYLIPTQSDWVDKVVASCTLPFVTKGKHIIDGEEYLDGGWSDPIPVKRAINKGAKRVVVLRTRPKDTLLDQSWADYFGAKYFNNHLGLKKVFEQSFNYFNESVQFMADPQEGVVIDQIAPTKLLKSGTYSYSKQSIMSDYRYGLDLGIQYLANKND